jgi:hypothetical protein
MLSCLYAGEMLGPEAGSFPVFPDIEYSERLLKQTGQTQGSPYNLASSLTITAIDLYHVFSSWQTSHPQSERKHRLP